MVKRKINIDSQIESVKFFSDKPLSNKSLKSSGKPNDIMPVKKNSTKIINNLLLYGFKNSNN